MFERALLTWDKRTTCNTHRTFPLPPTCCGNNSTLRFYPEMSQGPVSAALRPRVELHIRRICNVDEWRTAQQLEQRGRGNEHREPVFAAAVATGGTPPLVPLVWSGSSGLIFAGAPGDEVIASLSLEDDLESLLMRKTLPCQKTRSTVTRGSPG